MELLDDRCCDGDGIFGHIHVYATAGISGVFNGSVTNRDNSMIQARTSLHFSTILTWLVIVSLTFGFCAVWSLHFVAMLACDLDLPIGLDISLTLLSAVLAVLFTFAAVGSDLLSESYHRIRRKKNRTLKKKTVPHSYPGHLESQEPFLSRGEPFFHEEDADEDCINSVNDEEPATDRLLLHGSASPRASYEIPRFERHAPKGSNFDAFSPRNSMDQYDGAEVHLSTPSLPILSRSEESQLERNFESEYLEHMASSSEGNLTSSYRDSSSSNGIGELMNITYRASVTPGNAFVATYKALLTGFSRKSVIRGLVWSVAIWSMHFCGLAAMKIPDGYMTLNPIFMVLAEFVSWAVCIVGSIVMTQMEPHLSQQILFSTVATIGIASMHFIGKFPS